MKTIKNLCLLLTVTFILASCEKVFFRPQPEVNKLTIFDDFSKIFNEKYAMFEQKGVDWPQLSDSVRATIDGNTSEVALGEKMGYMVQRLEDGHSYLQAGDSLYTFDLLAGFDININGEAWVPNYLNGDTTLLQKPFFSLVLEDNIGYVFIQSFQGFTEDDIDAMLEPVKDTRGLIIDVRINPGGDPNISGELARRFTAEGYAAGTELFKTGPGVNDFSPQEINVTPATEGVLYRDKKVAILQGRLSYSATTTLLYLTDPNPNVVTFGGFSGGGTGSVASGYLINGWEYNLSVSDFVDAKGRKLDGGVGADFPVAIDFNDASEDAIIEAARNWILE